MKPIIFRYLYCVETKKNIMYGFKLSPIPNTEWTKKRTQRLETFNEGVGKCTSEVYTEEMEYFCRFSNGKCHVLKARYTEFRHDVKHPEDKTVIDWHWVDYPPYDNDVEVTLILPTNAI